MYINVCNKDYNIGIKLYPVCSKNVVKIFHSDNTTDINNDKLNEFINNNNKFNLGFCYTNTGLLYDAGNVLNLNIEYYAGWLFIKNHPPIHHAWAVLNGNVIDVSFRKSMFEILKTVDYSNPLWREGAAMRIKAKEKRILLSDDCVNGKVFDCLVFAGTKDTLELAKQRYNKLIERIPNHPSYAGRNNAHGMTEFQKQYYSI